MVASPSCCVALPPFGTYSVSFWFFRLSALFEWLSFFSVFFFWKIILREETYLLRILVCTYIRRYTSKYKRRSIFAYKRTRIFMCANTYSYMRICTNTVVFPVRFFISLSFPYGSIWRLVEEFVRVSKVDYSFTL